MSTVWGVQSDVQTATAGNDGGLADLSGTVGALLGHAANSMDVGEKHGGDSTGLKAGLAAAEFTGMNGIADWKDGKDIAGTPLIAEQAEQRLSDGRQAICRDGSSGRWGCNRGP